MYMRLNMFHIDFTMFYSDFNMCHIGLNRCYINLFKHGKGIMTCPHCRYSWGVETPEYMIELCVDEIKHKLGY